MRGVVAPHDVENQSHRGLSLGCSGRGLDLGGADGFAIIVAACAYAVGAGGLAAGFAGHESGDVEPVAGGKNGACCGDCGKLFS